jgi:hypothetical protein
MNKALYNKQLDEAAITRFQADIAQGFIDKLQNGSLRGTTEFLKHRVLVPVGEGSKPLLKATNKQEDGISDFDSNTLPIDELRVTKEIRLGYDFDAAENKEADLAYNKAFPISFRNAQLVIKQAGKPVLNMPISELIIDGVPTNSQDRYITLALPYVLVGVKKNEIDVVFSANATAKVVSSVTQKEYLEIIQVNTLYSDKV